VLGDVGKKMASRIDVRQACHLFLPMTSHGSAGMVCRSQRWRQSNDDAKAKRENLCRHSFAKRNAKGGMRCSKPAEFRQAKFALEN
jgi:hypothetical protein